MRSAARLWTALIVLLLLFVSGAAHAARHPRHQRHTRPARAGRAPLPPRPRTEEELALLAIQDDGERHVNSLLNATRYWTDRALLSARARRIEEMRDATRTRQLQVQAAFARRRGGSVQTTLLERGKTRVSRGSRRRA